MRPSSSCRVFRAGKTSTTRRVRRSRPCSPSRTPNKRNLVGANPAYHRWPTDWPPIAKSLLTTAERSNAVLVTVSNLYGYGEVSGPMTENLPLAAYGPKGLTRVQMWRDALAAHDAGRGRATEVRGSDYVGRGAQSHLGDRGVPRLLPGRDGPGT